MRRLPRLRRAAAETGHSPFTVIGGTPNRNRPRPASLAVNARHTRLRSDRDGDGHGRTRTRARPSPHSDHVLRRQRATFTQSSATQGQRIHCRGRSAPIRRTRHHRGRHHGSLSDTILAITGAALSGKHPGTWRRQHGTRSLPSWSNARRRLAPGGRDRDNVVPVDARDRHDGATATYSYTSRPGHDGPPDSARRGVNPPVTVQRSGRSPPPPSAHPFRSVSANNERS